MKTIKKEKPISSLPREIISYPTGLIKIFCISLVCWLSLPSGGSGWASAQNIAVNATGAAPAASAGFDVDFTNKGFLAPRVALTATNAAGPITLPATSLLVYNTATAGVSPNNVTPGYYYWDSAKWVAFGGSGGKDWSLLGNAGTVVGTNFLGTTDAVGLDFRTTNAIRARILSGGNFLINRTTALFATDLFEAQGDATFPDPISGYTAILNATGVYGEGTNGASATGVVGKTSIGTGVNGFANGAAGWGVWGDATLTTGVPIVATMAGSGFFSGTAISAIASTTLAGGRGVTAACDNATGTGVQGQSSGASGTGVFGTTSGATGTGVSGSNTAVAGAAIGFGGYFTSNQTGGCGLAGSLGVNTYFAKTAVSGITVSTLAGGTGVIGACDNATGRGVQGQSSGASGYGVYALNNGNVAGAAVFAGHTAGVAGTGFTIATARGAVKGEGAVAGSFGFGVIGSGGSSPRSGGVLGDDFNFARGALGYFHSNGINDYGVYAFGNFLTGALGGRMANGSEPGLPLETNNMIGMGICGGVMGGWIRGAVYGANIKGSNKYYSLYVDGKTYTNNVITQLETTVNGRQRIATYVTTSLSVDITERGASSLQNGKTYVPFNGDFKELVSEKEPVMITATPNSSSNGIYISSVTKEGFYVVENNNGTSNVPFTWIAVGTKKGQEDPQHASELMSLDFDNTMNGVMFNDANLEENGTPIWWDGTKVRHDAPPVVERESHFVEMAPMQTNESKNMNVKVATQNEKSKATIPQKRNK